MKILYVEDEAHLREEIALILEFEDHDVQTASDGQYGLEMYDEFKPDLIITDIKMPRLTGLDMLERIRERGDEDKTPAIVTSAFALREWKERAAGLGVSAYLTKPFSLDQLVNAIGSSATSRN